jgi:hypothetical protein
MASHDYLLSGQPILGPVCQLSHSGKLIDGTVPSSTHDPACNGSIASLVRSLMRCLPEADDRILLSELIATEPR